MRRTASVIVLIVLAGIFTNSQSPISSVETALPMSTRSHWVVSTSGATLFGAHSVVGSVPLVLGTATVNFTGNAAFTSASTYQCSPSNLTALNFVRPTYNSGSSVTFTGVGADTIGFICTGN